MKLSLWLKGIAAWLHNGNLALNSVMVLNMSTRSPMTLGSSMVVLTSVGMWLKGC